MRTLRLGDVLEIQNGFAFDSDFFSEHDGMPLIRIRDLREGIYTDTKYKGTFDESFKVTKGDYLIGMDGEFRCYKWKGQDALLNQRVCRLINFDSSVFPEYIFYGINVHLAKIERNTAFVTVKHISSKQIREIKFQFPPLQDQIRIANILSKAEALISQRKESIRLLDELLKCAFLDMFINRGKDGREIVTIASLAKDVKGSMRTGPFGSDLLHSEFSTTGDVKVLGIDNVVNNVFETGEPRYISVSKFEKLKRYKIFAGDVLITIMGTTGRTAVVPDSIPLSINTKHLAAITLDFQKANPFFISYSLRNDPYIIKQLKDKTRGAIMDGLNLGIIKSLAIKCPSISMQNQFENIIKKTEVLKAHYQSSLKELENLYGSLSQRAFKGELKLKEK